MKRICVRDTPLSDGRSWVAKAVLRHLLWGSNMSDWSNERNRKMVEASTAVNAVTGLLSVILTGLLVYLYKGMKDIQEEQTELQER